MDANDAVEGELSSPNTLGGAADSADFAEEPTSKPAVLDDTETDDDEIAVSETADERYRTLFSDFIQACEREESLATALKRATADAKSLRRKNDKLKAELHDHGVDAAQAQRELAALRKDLADTKALLLVRSDELRGVQAYVSTADKMSVAEVRRIVERLNAQTFQVAAALADNFRYRSDDKGLDKQRVQEEREALGAVRGMLGGRLVGILRAVRHDVDPYCVQVALQACLSVCVAEMSSQWGGPPGDDGAKNMSSIYKKIRAAGELIVTTIRMWTYVEITI